MLMESEGCIRGGCGLYWEMVCAVLDEGEGCASEG